MKKTTSAGFTLIELAVALTIVALVIGGLAVPMSKRLAEQQYTDTQINIDKAVEALVGFAVLNKRLPCPDIATLVADNRDGLEDAIAGGCGTGVDTGTINYANSSDASGASWGDLPWQTLGLAAPNNSDAWSNRLRYAVVTNFAMPTTAATNLITSVGAGGAANTLDLRCGNPANPATYVAAPGCLPNLPGPNAANFTATQSAAFVVYSMGANGMGGTSISSVTVRKLLASTVTLANTTIPDQFANMPEREATLALRRQFVVRARSDATSSAGEYDDVLTYVSTATLASKLLNAGIWP